MYTHEHILSFTKNNTHDLPERFISTLDTHTIHVEDLICGDGRHPETGKVSIFGQSVGLAVAAIHATKEAHNLADEQLCNLFDYLVDAAFDGKISHHTHEHDPDNCHMCGHIGQLLITENHEHYGLTTHTATHIKERLELEVTSGTSHKYILSGHHEEVVIIEEIGDHHQSIAHQSTNSDIQQAFVYTNTALLDKICAVIDKHITTFLNTDTFSGTKDALLEHTQKTAIALAPGMQVFSYNAGKDEVTYKTTLPIG